jgi:predicted transposase YbfD/YdcC
LGLAGVAQLIRVKRIVDTMRKGKVIKHTEEGVFFVTTLWSDEASPGELLELIRDHWSIENGQHHRRDRTQDEDRCMVSEFNSARVLSLFRSLAIFLYQAQRHKKGGKKSLPDFERKICRNPGSTIHRFVSSSS